jgi:hypothetical protein
MLGAPRSLVLPCRRAARDEQRHAVASARIARRFGAIVERPRVPPFAPASLEDLVMENAVEGCVREAFAALVAMHQAARAEDPAIARAHAAIAADEARHAALAWAVHRWGMRRVGRAARARVIEAQGSALRGLRDAAEAPWPSTVAQVAGLPSVATARRMVDGFAAAMGLLTESTRSCAARGRTAGSPASA